MVLAFSEAWGLFQFQISSFYFQKGSSYARKGTFYDPINIDGVNFSAVPEPSTMLLLGAGLLGLVGLGRKKFFKKS